MYLCIKNHYIITTQLSMKFTLLINVKMPTIIIIVQVSHRFRFLYIPRESNGKLENNNVNFKTFVSLICKNFFLKILEKRI